MHDFFFFGVDDLDGGRGAGVDVDGVEERVKFIESRIGPPHAKLSAANRSSRCRSLELLERLLERE